jgi:two-component system, chemotaxis family, chemotaxis protein CheY
MARILAVDDSAAMRQMVNLTLTSAGHEVVQASDGQEALDLATARPAVDLVITDINMPRMDGITLVRELRRLSHYRGVPLLLLTTESSQEKRQEGKAAGATGWMVKPFSPERLLAIVAKVVR